MNLEGELRVTLRLGRGRIQGLQVVSTRPDVAQTLLQGRTRAEVQAAVPLLFSVCARSQAVACELACAAAAGETVSDERRACIRSTLAAETVREIAWRALLQWPRALGEQPAPEAVAAARGAQRWRGPGNDADADADADADKVAQAIARTVFGAPAHAWLQQSSWAALADWAAAGGTAAARYIHRLHGAAAAAPAPAPASTDTAAAPTVPLLDEPTPHWLAELAATAAADPAFCRHPLWNGRPAETGALACLHGDPLVGRGAPAAPSRELARHVARLRELAGLLSGQALPGFGALALAPGSGVAWVDNARGLLVHHVQLVGERVRLVRIVAPTEWNFHPQGALAAGLRDAPAADADEARHLATRLIDSLDPCVACHVEVEATAEDA